MFSCIFTPCRSAKAASPWKRNISGYQLAGRAGSFGVAAMVGALVVDAPRVAGAERHGVAGSRAGDAVWAGAGRAMIMPQ